MPLHPYIVHFSVGLLLTGAALFFVAAAFPRRPWAESLRVAARWNFWIGAGFALASIGSGFIDYLSTSCDQAAIDATVVHRRTGAVTWWSSLIAGIALYRTRQRPPGRLLLAWILLVATAATTAAILGTGLTYDRGLGTTGTLSADGLSCFEAERQGGV